MAEYAAHSTSAISHKAGPTIFEVLAQENFLAKPALKHVVKVLVGKWPSTFSRIYRWFDEAYLTFDVILQHYCLLKYRASYAEKFYDLQRTNDGSTQLLTTQQHVISLLSLVFFPYIKDKLDDLYQEISRVYSENTTPVQDTIPRLYKFFIRLYPYIHSSWRAVCLLYHISYALGWTPRHSLGLKLAGLRLCVREIDNIVAQPYKSFEDQKSPAQKLHYIVTRGIDLAATLLSNSLTVAVFFVQFLQWWYNREGVGMSLVTHSPPKPPTISTQLPEGITNKHCPLCRRIRTNHTALLVSGYVFCYPCIYRYVSENGRCPVTHYPAKTDHIVKLYMSDT